MSKMLIVSFVIYFGFRIHCVSAQTDATYFNNFIDTHLISLPKCCPDKDVISLEPTPHCIEATHAFHLHILSPKIIANFSVCTHHHHIECLDIDNASAQLVVVKNCVGTLVKTFTYYPKCCPLNYVYATKAHSCLKTNDTISRPQDLLIVKTSLSHCAMDNEAIVDFHLHTEHLLFNADKALIRPRTGTVHNFGSYCIDTDIVRVCLPIQQACNHHRRCLWKCCPDGEVYRKIARGPSKCTPQATSGFNITALQTIENPKDDNFAIIVKESSVAKKYVYTEDTQFRIDGGGNVRTEVNHQDAHFSWSMGVYCFETLERWSKDAVNYNSVEQLLFIFVFDSQSHETFLIHGIILLISAICLIFTLLCYLTLPEMQNLHGRCITMECIFLLIGSSVLFVAKIFVFQPSLQCKFIAYCTIFAFLGVFAWLNIICVDMWMTFGVLRGFNMKEKNKERRKFLVYCLYGFGVPSGITGFIIVAENIHFLPESLTPHIGRTNCNFDVAIGSSWDYIVYFVLPMCLMLLINVVLFVKTTVYCIKVKNEIQKMREIGPANEKGKRSRRFKSDKEKLMMISKLFMIMGIPWTFEVLATIVSFKSNVYLKYIEFTIDTFNSAKGILMFCVFILKRKIINSIKARLGFERSAQQVSELSSLTMTTVAR